MLKSLLAFVSLKKCDNVDAMLRMTTRLSVSIYEKNVSFEDTSPICRNFDCKHAHQMYIELNL